MTARRLPEHCGACGLHLLEGGQHIVDAFAAGAVLLTRQESDGILSGHLFCSPAHLARWLTHPASTPPVRPAAPTPTLTHRPAGERAAAATGRPALRVIR